MRVYILFIFFPSVTWCDEAVPLLDFSLFRSDEKHEEFLVDLKNALSGPGFVRFKNHGLNQELLDQAVEDSYNFFRLPEEEKRQYLRTDPRSTYGYCEMHSTILYGEPGYQEAFGVNLTKNNGSDLKEHELFKDTVLYEYTQEMTSFVHEILRAFAIVLEIDEDFFLATHDWNKGEILGVIRMNYYPPIPDGLEPSRFGPHSDFLSVATIITDEAGLEVWDYAADQWVAVPHDPETIVVNTGNLMQFWTNDLFKSTLHRVRHSEETRKKERMSVVYFLGPNPSTVVDTHDIFPGATSHHEKVTAADFLYERVEYMSDVEGSISAEDHARPYTRENFIKTEL